MLNGFRGSADYVASDDLMNSVNVAMALKKPLLVKGEPGTGKTKLAEAIAASLDMELIIWSIKSTTKAQDGLYVYDTVQRLYDSQFGEANVGDISKYIKLGKMGEAFKSDKQVVLLIDEIDKADLEFLDETLINQAMEAFYWIRSMNEIQKKPSTSELLDWLQALSLGGIDPEKVASNFPFIGTLLKKNQDIDTFESYKKGRIRFR